MTETTSCAILRLPVCTIVALREVHADYPLVIAANRDEFYAREATPPEVLVETPRVIAGRDVESGGTWMGVTAAGFFAGISNQRTYRGNDPTLASRGPLVRRVLELGARDAARELLAKLDGRDYNGFNLLFGDAHGLEVAYARTDRRQVEIQEVSPGVQVLCNDRIGSPEFPKADRAADLAAPAAGQPWPEARETLRRALADHQKPPIDAITEPPAGSRFTRDFIRELQAICIHTPTYGTRSATLIAVVPGAVAHYEYADGPPCQTPWGRSGHFDTLAHNPLNHRR